MSKTSSNQQDHVRTRIIPWDFRNKELLRKRAADAQTVKVNELSREFVAEAGWDTLDLQRRLGDDPFES